MWELTVLKFIGPTCQIKINQIASNPILNSLIKKYVKANPKVVREEAELLVNLIDKFLIEIR